MRQILFPGAVLLHNTLCHGQRVMLHLRHNKNRMWLKESQTIWASKAQMCLRRAGNDSTSERCTSEPPSSHSKHAGGGTAASVNTPQSPKRVTHDLGLMVHAGVCAASIGTSPACDCDRVCNVLQCDRGGGRGWWGGGTSVSAVKGDMCVSMFNPGSRSDIWLACLTATAVRRKDGSHQSSFCCNDRFKWPPASS